MKLPNIAIAIALCSLFVGCTHEPCNTGTISVLRVFGEVTCTSNGRTWRLDMQDTIPLDAIVTTESEAGVALSFSNGASLSLGPATKIAIKGFNQAPIPRHCLPHLSPTEPVPSHVFVRLLQGCITGQVKAVLTPRSFVITTHERSHSFSNTRFRLVCARTS